MIQSCSLITLCTMIVLGSGFRIIGDTSKKLLARSTRVVDGAEISIERIPWQINLVNLWGRSNHSHCGGSIISSNWVVTAGHCVCSETWSPLGPLEVVLAGSNNYEKGSRHTIVEVICHPLYWMPDNENLLIAHDIALLRVVEPFIFSRTEQPIPLYNGTRETVAQSEATVSGWGLKDSAGSTSANLKAATMEVISSLECEAFLSTVDKNRISTSAKICAKPRSGLVCDGDSGGPLTINGTLVGITSWGAACTRDDPQVFTEVAHYRDWILKNTSR